MLFPRFMIRGLQAVSGTGGDNSSFPANPKETTVPRCLGETVCFPGLVHCFRKCQEVEAELTARDVAELMRAVGTLSLDAFQALIKAEVVILKKCVFSDLQLVEQWLDVLGPFCESVFETTTYCVRTALYVPRFDGVVWKQQLL